MAHPQRYVVLARKYRPETFADLIGQEAMVTTLKNAFATDRIAQGYMLTGVRGVGKTTTARILARALNYSKPGLPDKPTVELDGYGEHCAEIIASSHPDVHGDGRRLQYRRRQRPRDHRERALPPA